MLHVKEVCESELCLNDEEDETEGNEYSDEPANCDEDEDEFTVEDEIDEHDYPNKQI